MKDGMKKGVFREGDSPGEIIDFGKHVGKTFKDVYLNDQEYCSWTMKQEGPGARKLVQIKYFLRRMQDLTKRNMGMCGKADEIERQLRDRILQLSCEEQMGKLMRQSAERFEKQEEERKAEANQKEKERQWADWADIDADEPVCYMTYMNLGDSVQIEYPQEEQQQEQWRQGGQSAEERVEGWIRQGEEETGCEEDKHGGREGTDGQGREGETIESENDTGKEDWGHSLEQKRANDIRRERREKERVNWNSGGQAKLSGFGQDHWEGEMGSWYQDQWWGSRSWRGKSETKGFGRMETHWRRSREKFQSDGGSTSKGEGGYSGSKNENRWERPRRREGSGNEDDDLARLA